MNNEKEEIIKLIDDVFNIADINADDLKDKLNKALFDARMKSILNNFFPDHNADCFTYFKSGTTNYLTIRLDNIKDYKKAHKIFKPIKDRIYIDSATSKTKVINTPYRIDLKNNAVPSSFLKLKNGTRKTIQSKFTISYKTNIEFSFYKLDLDLKIVFNAHDLLYDHIDVFSEIIKPSTRKLYDSEHHYFTGYSFNQLKKQTIRSFSFHDPNTIKWHGGNETLINTWHIDNIIAYLIENK